MNILPALEAIETAFDNVTLGDGLTLHQAQLADQSLTRDITDEEFLAAGKIDVHTTWKDVSDADLQSCDAALSHLDEKGWRFYIPAYMRLSLKMLAGSAQEAWGIPDQTIFHLKFSEKNGLAGFSLGRFGSLTEPQCIGVKLFLETMQQSESYEKEAMRALKRYWGLSPKERPKLIILD